MAKSGGFKVVVTYSHSAPYGFVDTSTLMQAFLMEANNIDALSPQLYTKGDESSNDDTEQVTVPWSDYVNTTQAIIPSLVNGGICFTDAQEYLKQDSVYEYKDISNGLQIEKN